MYDETFDRWFARGSAVSLPADQITMIGEVPRGVRLTVQVTLNVLVTEIGIGFMGDS